MKLLIVTQALDQAHPILGFFHRWIEEFAKHFEHIHVIALQYGKSDLPYNAEEKHAFTRGASPRVLPGNVRAHFASVGELSSRTAEDLARLMA